MIDRTDFYEDVKPWLKKLEDDPDRPTPTIKTTTITGEAIEIEGEISPLDDGEIPSQYQTKVDQGDAEAARSVRPMAGLDILAFYKSFRFIDRHPLPGNWGVFILDAGLEGLAQDLVVLKPNLPLEELRIFSKRVLLAHELYHFWTDAWALGQEIMPLLTKYKRYEYYLEKKQQVELTEHDFEESLANHYAYIKLKDHRFSDKSVADLMLRKLLEDSPIPYSDFFSPHKNGLSRNPG